MLRRAAQFIATSMSKTAGCAYGLVSGFLLGCPAFITNAFAQIHERVRRRPWAEQLSLGPFLVVVSSIVVLPAAILIAPIYGACRGAQLGFQLGLPRSFLGVPKELFTFDARTNDKEGDRNILFNYRKFNIANSLLTRGKSHLESSRYDLAIVDFSEAIKFNPNQELYIQRGIAYFNEEKPKKAVADFDQARKFGKLSSSVHYFYSEAHSKLASKKHEKANQLDSENVILLDKPGRVG